MPAALDGVRSKIIRAQQHFADIHARIRISMPSKDSGQSIAPLYEVDRERRQLILRLPKPEPLDALLPLIIGDCVHNLRSALDHIVFQLAILNQAGPDAAKKTSFPICIDKSSFKDAVKKKVKPFIGSAALAAIEKFQPYETTNMPTTAILWQLSELDIFDKHRLLVVALRRFKPVAFDVTLPDGKNFAHEITNSEWKPSEDGAEILRFEFSEIPEEMKVNVTNAMTVQFGNAGLACDGLIVEDILDQSGRMVEMIVDEMGGEFFGE